MTKETSVKLIPVLVLGLFSSSVWASGFQLSEQNASGLGNFYAGAAAATENASTIFYNPAGMTQLQAREFSAGVSVLGTSLKFTNNGSNAGSLAGTGNGGDGGAVNAAPNGYISAALSKDVYLGLGLGSPFSLKSDYSNPWLGAAQATSFDLRTYNINPSMAVRVNDKVSLGVGADWQRITTDYQRQYDTTAAGSNSPLRIKLRGSAVGWNAGVLFTVSPSTKLGISYRSELNYNTTGTADVTGTLAGTGLASDTKAKITLPSTFSFSVSQILSDKWQMMGDITRTGWSSVPKIEIFRTSGALFQTIDTAFRDTWRVGLGANYKYSAAVKFKFGIAYDQTPVKSDNTRLVFAPENDRFWLSFGTQWALGKGSALDLGLAYGLSRNAKINNVQTAATLGTVAGSYDDRTWVLGAQYSTGF